MPSVEQQYQDEIDELREQLAAKDAEIASAAETLRLSQLQYELVTERADKSSQKNERLRVALEADGLECMKCNGNGVVEDSEECEGEMPCRHCDGTGFEPPDSVEMRAILGEALAATPPANPCKDCGVILPCWSCNIENLCSDCPPVGYPTDKTRCVDCPRTPPAKEKTNAD